MDRGQSFICNGGWLPVYTAIKPKANLFINLSIISLFLTLLSLSSVPEGFIERVMASLPAFMTTSEQLSTAEWLSLTMITVNAVFIGMSIVYYLIEEPVHGLIYNRKPF